MGFHERNQQEPDLKWEWPSMFQLRSLLWHRVGVRVRCRRPGQASAAGTKAWLGERPTETPGSTAPASRLLHLKVPPGILCIRQEHWQPARTCPASAVTLCHSQARSTNEQRAEKCLIPTNLDSLLPEPSGTTLSPGQMQLPANQLESTQPSWEGGPSWIFNFSLQGVRFFRCSHDLI